MKMFADRIEAGRKLAEQLKPYANREDLIVLGVPRGGVPVAFEVAAALKAPLDILVLRKLGVPWQEELAFGAIAQGGVRVLDRKIMEMLSLTTAEVEQVTAKEQVELARREKAYRGDRPPLDVRGRTVILVDDGIATGSSMRAAIAALRQMGPAKIVLAVPVAPPSTCERLRPEVDDLICVDTPESFYAIGQFYLDFSPVGDWEVTDLLARAAGPASETAGRKR
jgi:putative phosphoribosyl transferase